MGRGKMVHLKFIGCFLPLLMISCVTKPPGMEPVGDFEVERYLGLWYEIARLDHSFERGMDKVTAAYAIRQDGGISVTNRGYDRDKGKWREAIGKAYFVEDDRTGFLKVSFFGPFYGAYVIFELDPEYGYAFVSGPDLSYLWLLSRKPLISDGVKQKFRQTITKHGYDADELIWVNQVR